MSDTTQFDVVAIRPSSQRWLDIGLVLLCVLIGAVATTLYIHQPEQAAAWLVAGLFLPSVLFITRTLPGLAYCDQGLRSSLTHSLLAAGILILVPLALRLAEGIGWLDIGGVRRSTGVLLGGALMVAGSYSPQKLLPGLRERLDPTSAVRIARQIGAGLMFAGFGYALIWLLAPLLHANLWASIGAAVALLCAGLCSLLGVSR